MKKSEFIALAAVAVLGLTRGLLVPAVAADAVAAPPAPAVPVASAIPPRPAHAAEKGQLDAELEVARKQLEQAAHEVARLSTQLSGAMLGEVMPLTGPHVVIGVQLEPATDNAGARVREVSPGGPAAEAGIRRGDVIVSVNGTEVRGESPAEQVSSILRGVKADTVVGVRVQRDGKPLDFKVTPRAAPGLFGGAPGTDAFAFAFPEFPGVLLRRPLQDMELATLTPRLGSYFGSDKGVLVVRAPAEGALKLEDGDVILAIDGREPMSGSHATRILSSYQSGEKITLRIIRQHKPLDLQTTLPQQARHLDMLRHGVRPPPPSEGTSRETVIIDNDDT